jgi:hypothetical protein
VISTVYKLKTQETTRFYPIQKRNPTGCLLLVLMMRLQCRQYQLYGLVKVGFVLRMVGVSELHSFAQRPLMAFI